MTFTYYLPDANNAPEPHETEKNAIIIIGANGSGKSHLGAWMEMHDKEDRIHRIGGQRNLSFNAKIHLKATQKRQISLYMGSLMLRKNALNGIRKNIQRSLLMILRAF